jgi:hypothetical protein
VAADITTGDRAWEFLDGAYVSDCELADLDCDGDLEIVVTCSSTCNGSRGTRFDDNHGYIYVLDLSGEMLWSTVVGGKFCRVSSCILKECPDRPSQIFVVIENRDPDSGRPSNLFLLDSKTGMVLDHLAYQDQFTGLPKPLRSDRESSWSVFCGSKYGHLRKYVVLDSEIAVANTRKLGDGPIVPIADEIVYGINTGLVVNVSDAPVQVLSSDFRTIGRLRAESGRTIQVLSSFTDDFGNQYLVAESSPQREIRLYQVYYSPAAWQPSAANKVIPSP